MPQRNDLTEHFAAALTSADPVRLALAIARIAYPDLDADQYIAQLAAMAGRVSARVKESAPGGARALALMEAMRGDLGLRGNTERYYDASNSFLNVVLDTRKGLPITLSLVVVAVGRQIGLDVAGAGFPGHFMVRYADEQGIWFLDAFHGTVMTGDDVPGYLVKLFGQNVATLDPSYFEPLAPAAWAQRILNNLHAVYMNAGNLEMLAKVVVLMLVLEPGRGELWQELGLVEYRRGELTRAARALRRFFFLQGHLALSAPNSSIPPSAPMLDDAERQLWELLEEIEAACIRWN